jgi:hypothetical protein
MIINVVYFTAIGNILLSFGTFGGNLVYFSPFWYFGPRKIWQPCSKLVQFFVDKKVFEVGDDDAAADMLGIAGEPCRGISSTFFCFVGICQKMKCWFVNDHLFKLGAGRGRAWARDFTI